MATLYGSLFLDRWREVDPRSLRETWAVELAGFRDKPEAIRDALAALRDVPLPPTLPEFMAMCRIAAKRSTLASLPAPPIDFELARQRIAEIKARMRKAA